MAVKTPEDQIIPTLADPRFDGRRFVLVPPDAPVGISTPSGPADIIADPVSTEMPREGQYRFTLAAPAAAGRLPVGLGELVPRLARHGGREARRGGARAVLAHGGAGARRARGRSS